jgi:hypothetical protein
MGLNDLYREELFDAGVDFIGFSIAGVIPQTHNSIRAHLDLGKLSRKIRTFQEIKAHRQIDDFLKSPSAALRCILRRCGVPPKYASLGRFCAPGPAKRGRAFYLAIHFDGSPNPSLAN